MLNFYRNPVFYKQESVLNEDGGRRGHIYVRFIDLIICSTWLLQWGVRRMEANLTDIFIGYIGVF